MVEQNSVYIVFDNNKFVSKIFEDSNQYLPYIQDCFNVKIIGRGNKVSVLGDKKQSINTVNLLKRLAKNLNLGIGLSIDNIDTEIYNIDKEGKSFKEERIVINTTKRKVKPISKKQEEYINTLFDKEVVFATGAAGTGKTYLAVAVAVHMYLLGEVERIILTRPAIEAGEKIGFLPGDMKEKVDPFMQPIYDALYDMLSASKIQQCLDSKIFEILPLAFMRGRTIKNSYIILDEAQNTTTTQMKMFLTRLGVGSRMSISGDLSQIDLPNSCKSGLQDAIEKLHPIKDIGIINFTSKDIVRHKLVTKILDLYDKKQ